MELFSKEDYVNAKYYQLLPVRCDICGKDFNRDKKSLVRARRLNLDHCCSKPCSTKSSINKKGQKGPIEVNCTNCGKKTRKAHSQIKKYKNSFCSRSCSAIWCNQNKPKKAPPKCLYCDSPLLKTQKKYCSIQCHTNKTYDEKVEGWKNGVIKGYSGLRILLKRFVRKYIFEKYNSRCCECGWNKINPKTNSSPLEIHHIDGDAKNCHEDNLKLLCPSCHSLTENYGSLNKGSPRIRS